jgi:Raf kinase inhibitor-like YbhB/YbcL family protein
MKLTSSAFTHFGGIPVRHTCEGADVSPPLAWSEVPHGAAAFALIVDDPDAPDPTAPQRTWVHWVLVDLPAEARAIPDGGPLPHGTRVGLNDWKRPRWNGPCPPVGRHRYFFKLYALKTRLPWLESPTAPELEAAIAGKILAQAELVGTYRRRSA